MFERVFRWVAGKEFERCFIVWMHEIRRENELGIAAVDGKDRRNASVLVGFPVWKQLFGRCNF